MLMLPRTYNPYISGAETARIQHKIGFMQFVFSTGVTWLKAISHFIGLELAKPLTFESHHTDMRAEEFVSRTYDSVCGFE